MTDSIPGGRQRASSLGDALDEDDDESGFYPRPLTNYHRQYSRSLGLHLENTEPTDGIFEQEKYRTLPSKPKRRGRPSFKTVKNFMHIFMYNNSNKREEEEWNGHSGKGGMGHSRRKGDSSPQRSESTQESERSYSESTSRPLVTKTAGLFTPTWEKTPGRIGILNHGNTCFMNAVIQCLNNTDCFADYFIRKLSKDESGGKTLTKRLGLSRESSVSEQLGLLLYSLWSDRYNNDISNVFKNVVGRVNNQYKGSSQHDSQEFLMWLLDRINEDLLLQKKKQSTLNQLMNKSSVGKKRTDEQAAEEILLNNNGCPLYNLFQALYRSSLQCLKCEKQSNTFETYTCMSLPLPNKIMRPVFVIVVEQIEANSPPKQTKIGLKMDANATVKELRAEVSRFTDIYENRLVLCQIYDDGFRNTYGDEQPLTDIGECETIHAIETLPVPRHEGQPNEYDESYVQILLVHTEKESNPTKYFRFCMPQVLQVPREIGSRQLQRKILYDLDYCVKEGLSSQKLEMLFKLRLVDGSPGKDYLPAEVDMPLFIQTVDRALSTYGSDYGPKHIKLVAEWEPSVKRKVIVYDIDKVEESSSVKHVKQQQHQAKVSLDECLQLFTKEEKLTDENAWLCPHCKHQQLGATKTLGLWSLPDVLVIHLKRFRQVGLRRNKLNTLIDFPVKHLDMTKHILRQNGECNINPELLNLTQQQERLHQGVHKDNQMYDLYGVCNHYGNMLGGHYTAFCKNNLDGKWYEYDDSKVKHIAESEVKTSAAYMLFYQRHGFSSIINEDLQSGSHWIYNLYPNKKRDDIDSRQSHDRHGDAAHHAESRNVQGRQDENRQSHDNKPSLRDWQKTETGLTVKLDDQRNSPSPSVNSDRQYTQHNRPDNKHYKSDGTIKPLSNRHSVHEIGLRVDLEGAINYRENEKMKQQTHKHSSIKNDQKYPPSPTQQPQNYISSERVKSKPPVDLPVKEKSSMDSSRAVTPGSPRKQINNHQPSRQKDSEDKVVYKPPPVPIRNQSLGFRKGKDTSQTRMDIEEKQSSKPAGGFSTPPMTKRKGSENNQTKAAWSTPQPPRRQNGQSDQTDGMRTISPDTSKRPPRPPPIQRQLSMPHRNRPDIPVSSQNSKMSSKESAKEYHNGSVNENHNSHDRVTPGRNHDRQILIKDTGVSDNFSENSRRNISNNKFATIARTNNKHPKDNLVIEKTKGIPKSRTDGSLSSVDRNFVNATGTPLVNQARSRQPVYGTSCSDDSLSDRFPRYQPHRHYYKQLPYKEQENYFKKEKMYSPCLKESSV